MELLNALIENNRLLAVLHDNLHAGMKQSALYAQIGKYLSEYCVANNIDAQQADEIYMRYITAYNKHCKQFIKTGKYPLENGINDFSVTREEYDAVLLMSVVFTPHRYRIMQLLTEQNQIGNALFIGLGPGLEIFLTLPLHTSTDAYDVSLNEKLAEQFPTVHFHADYYSGQNENSYDSIYLIEILEHLPEPYQLLEICKISLKKGGKILLTTATDIPQFDHMYNFPDNHSQFEARCNEMGLSVLKKEKLEHSYLTSELKPSNHFYVLQK